MKKLYNFLLDFLKYIPVCLEVIKYHIFERIKMIKDYKVYSSQKLSAEEIARIDIFWLTNYGKKINKAWHRYYMLFTGELDEKYFPQIIYSTRLEHKLNPWYYTLVLSDKNLMSSIFGDTVYCPIIYGKRCRGRYFDKTGSVVCRNKFFEKINGCGKVVIKPTVGSSSGLGVRVCNFNNGIDTISGEAIEKIIASYSSDFNIQEFIKQSSVLSAIYPNSLNTFRVITYIANHDIHVAPIAMRFGANGNTVDNIHAGGIMIGVNNDGSLNKYGYYEFGTKLEEHPNTHVQFENYKIPSVDKIIDIAKKLHKKVSCLGMISWDFTLNEHNEVVLIEVNLKGQSVCFPQEVHGKSLFGDNTADILKLIKR